jgi:hypothetical protein
VPDEDDDGVLRLLTLLPVDFLLLLLYMLLLLLLAFVLSPRSLELLLLLPVRWLLPPPTDAVDWLAAVVPDETTVDEDDEDDDILQITHTQHRRDVHHITRPCDFKSGGKQGRTANVTASSQVFPVLNKALTRNSVAGPKCLSPLLRLDGWLTTRLH